MRSEEFNPLRMRLSEDVTYFNIRLGDETNKNIIRRSYVRAVFAFIEGYLYAFKQISLRISEESEGIKLSPEEIIALKEVEVSIDDSGNIKQRSKYIPARKSLVFSIASIAKQHEADFILDKGGQGSEAYQVALKIRDRLMHPKSHRELELTDIELESVQVAYNWFTNELSRLEVKIGEAATQNT
tara:strand:+ start:265 stop:819 length:555 start_codon:yes stop_codon:yes gene_type:complete